MPEVRSFVQDKNNTLNIPDQQRRVGTIRYMSPEVLDLR